MYRGSKSLASPLTLFSFLGKNIEHLIQEIDSKFHLSDTLNLPGFVWDFREMAMTLGFIVYKTLMMC